MMQESVYCKIAQNATSANAIADHVRKNAPSDGLVQLLTITEKQFANMEMIVGESKTDVVTTSDRMVVL